VAAIIALVLSRLDYSRLRELKWGLFGAMLLSPAGHPGLRQRHAGSAPGHPAAGFSFQASELGKVLITPVLAAFLVDARGASGTGTRRRARCCSSLVPPRS
jgi:rod shape determining protein RodA